MAHVETGPVVDPKSGAPRRLADIVGEQSTLLYWIKSVCPTCRLAMPFVDRLAARVAPGRIAVVAQDEPADIEPFRTELGLESVPIWCEPEPYQSSDAYGLTHVPTWFLIAPSGDILESGSMFSQADLEHSLSVLGGEGPLFTPEETVELPDSRPG